MKTALGEILRENFSFRKQIAKLSKSQLIKQYKGAALGPLWAVIRPAMTIFVYWFAFEIGLRKNKPVTINGIETPFFLFLLVGMIPWFFMKDAILDGANCFRKNKQFITKMSFPVSTIPTFTLLADLYVHIGLTAVMYVILLLMGVQPTVYNLQILFYMPMMYLFFLCVSWFTAPLAAVSKDFLNAVRSIIVAFFWLSGIIWNPYGLESPVLRHIVLATPITYFSNGYRNAFLYERWFFTTHYETVCMLLWVVAFAVLGVFTYRRLRRVMPDVL